MSLRARTRTKRTRWGTGLAGITGVHMDSIVRLLYVLMPATPVNMDLAVTAFVDSASESVFTISRGPTPRPTRRGVAWRSMGTENHISVKQQQQGIGTSKELDQHPHATTKDT